MIFGLELEIILLDNLDKKIIEIVFNCIKCGVYGFEKVKIISYFLFGLVFVWSYI